MAAAMGRVAITLSDFMDAFPYRPSDPSVEDEVCLDSPSAAPRAAATRAASAARNLARARTGADGRASSDDEQPLGTPGPRRRRRFEAPHCAPQAAAYPAFRDRMPIPLSRMYTNSVDGNCKRVARAAVKNDDQEPAPPERIFEALREIPRLERADLLRAYSTLIRDDRLFRSLMALPKDMRRDWLLMEIGNQCLSCFRCMYLATDSLRDS